MTDHQTLRNLEAAERKAWKAKMSPKANAADVCTVFGQEGSLELAWRKTADACRDYREAHGLLGLSWKQIEGRRK